MDETLINKTFSFNQKLKNKAKVPLCGIKRPRVMVDVEAKAMAKRFLEYPQERARLAGRMVETGLWLDAATVVQYHDLTAFEELQTLLHTEHQYQTINRDLMMLQMNELIYEEK